MEIMDFFKQAVEQEASDIFLIPGMPFSYKIGGNITYQGEEKIFPEEMDRMIAQIYQIAGNRDMSTVLSGGDDDFSFAISGLSRFRASVMRQRGSLAAKFPVPEYSAERYRYCKDDEGAGFGDRTCGKRKKHDLGQHYQ